jgi:hypothetical protein
MYTIEAVVFVEDCRKIPGNLEQEFCRTTCHHVRVLVQWTEARCVQQRRLPIGRSRARIRRMPCGGRRRMQTYLSGLFSSAPRNASAKAGCLGMGVSRALFRSHDPRSFSTHNVVCSIPSTSSTMNPNGGFGPSRSGARSG